MSLRSAPHVIIGVSTAIGVSAEVEVGEVEVPPILYVWARGLERSRKHIFTDSAQTSHIKFSPKPLRIIRSVAAWVIWDQVPLDAHPKWLVNVAFISRAINSRSKTKIFVVLFVEPCHLMSKWLDAFSGRPCEYHKLGTEAIRWAQLLSHFGILPIVPPSVIVWHWVNPWLCTPLYPTEWDRDYTPEAQCIHHFIATSEKGNSKKMTQLPDRPKHSHCLYSGRFFLIFVSRTASDLWARAKWDGLGRLWTSIADIQT